MPRRTASRAGGFVGRGETARGAEISVALGLELRLVFRNESADLVGHVEQLGPLLLVERHREAAEAVHRDPSLLRHLERRRPAALLLEALVLGAQALKLHLQIVVGHRQDAIPTRRRATTALSSVSRPGGVGRRRARPSRTRRARWAACSGRFSCDGGSAPRETERGSGRRAARPPPTGRRARSARRSRAAGRGPRRRNACRRGPSDRRCTRRERASTRRATRGSAASGRPRRDDGWPGRRGRGRRR